jgi:arginyl-tRNA synthetase
VGQVLATLGTLRFFYAADRLPALAISQILVDKEAYGRNVSGAGKKALIEFSSPNIAKMFHAGHLRSTIIGAFLSNLYELSGWEVVRMNYLGDWGKQFGLLAVGFEMFGDEKLLQEDPIQHLFDIYVKVNKVKEEDETIDERAREYFRKMEQGDVHAKGLWEHFRDVSIVRYKQTYARLNTRFDVYSGESQVSPTTMEKACGMLEEKDLVYTDKGALLIDFSRHGSKNLGKALIKKSDGTTLYLTRDIGAAMERYETYKFDKMIYVVASQQDMHVAQLFKILKLLGLEWADRCVHVSYGMVEGMSTRKGTVVFLEDILNETAEKMHDVMRTNEAKYAQVENPDATADKVGISAVLIQDMSAKR